MKKDKNTEPLDEITLEELNDRIEDAQKQVKEFCSYWANSFWCWMATWTRDTLVTMKEIMQKNK